MVSTRPILQAAEVLAVGGDYRRSERQQRASYGTVTLLVTMEEAAKLIFAQDYYSVTMTLVLRSSNDAVVSEELTTISVDTRNFDEIGNEPNRED
jgi:Flp pilus assembly protein CpaB